MYSLRSVDVGSCAKIMGAIYGCVGLVMLPFFLFGGFASLISGKDTAAAEVMIFCLVLLTPVFYGVVGLIAGTVTAWIYNFVARRIGGIRLELKPEGPNPQSRLGLI